MFSRRAFTLVELLVVISIIGLLSTIASVSLSSVRLKARDMKRASDITSLRDALELYYTENSAYPVAAAWFGATGNCWGTVTNNWIPGLSPTYMAKLPLDPKPGMCTQVYIYSSNGTDYKIIAMGPESCESSDMKNLKDPARDGGASASVVDGSSCWAWAVYTPGAVAW
jgi:prepilin-type N-terminal cleavage/methylation domain-containing protein